MAKIKTVEFVNTPSTIVVGDDITDIQVMVKVEFHQLDIRLEMEYVLYVFIYDICGAFDTQFLIPNWDETKINPLVSELKDDFFGKSFKKVLAKESLQEISFKMDFQLGQLKAIKSPYSKKLNAYAVLIPCIGVNVKQSNIHNLDLVY